MTYLDVPAKWVFVERKKATGTYDEPNCYDCSQAFNSDQDVVRFRFESPATEQQDPDTYLMHDRCWRSRLGYEAEQERLRNPQVEIAGYRDPDGDTTLVVFVNGERREDVRIGVVDPGAGYPYKLSEWRENTFDVVRAGGSEKWTQQMITFYDRVEGEGYVNDDTVPGVDPQPGVTTMAEMDPDLWLGDGTLRRNDSDFDDHEHDNTLRAAWGLIALKAAHQASAEGSMAMAEAARVAHARATRTTIGEIGESVQDLLTDLWHLLRARELEPERVFSEPDTTMQALVVALREAVEGAWAELIDCGRDWDDIETSAFQRYIEELVGT